MITYENPLGSALDIGQISINILKVHRYGEGFA
jgi:hypothetical protein